MLTLLIGVLLAVAPIAALITDWIRHPEV